MTKPFELIQKSAEQAGVSAGEYFVKDGLDYKGQVQYAYTINGKGAAFDIKIDPGKLMGLTAAVGVKLAARQGKEVLVVGLVGPQKIVCKVPNQKAPQQLTESSVSLPQPIVLSSMQGTFWEGQAGASFELGVSYSAHAGISRDGVSAQAGSSLDSKSDDDSQSGRAELISASFEASAGFKADAAYVYSNAALEDVRPRYYGASLEGADKAAFKMDATDVFASGSSKDVLKTQVVEFMNQHQDIFGKQEKTRWFGISNRPVQDLVDTLLKGAASVTPKTDKSIALKACIENWAARLAPYCGGFEQLGKNILVISSHKPEASAGLSAKVEAKAAVGPLANVGVALDLRGPAIAGAGKWSSSRFQTYWPLSDGQSLMFTQESKLCYWQVDVTAFVAEVQAAGSVVDPKGTGAGLKSTAQSAKDALTSKDASKLDASKAGVQRVEFDKKSTLVDQKKVWNSLSYTAADAYWIRPANDAFKSGKCSVQLLGGSGLSMGRSTVLANLKLLLAAGWDPVIGQFSGSNAALKHYFMLAEALHIPVKMLAEAIWSPEVKSLINDLSSQDAALEQAIKGMNSEQADRARKLFAGGELPLLIEVAFRLPFQEATVEKNKDGLIKLEGKFFDNVVGAFNQLPGKTLPSLIESLRIRVRMRDLKESTGGFKLGFKVLGQELGIGYETIERAGAEGTVDLATYWFAQDKRSGGVSAYEAGVPKVLLFDQ